jgi:hypothetical protein
VEVWEEGHAGLGVEGSSGWCSLWVDLSAGSRGSSKLLRFFGMASEGRFCEFARGRHI